MQSAKQFFLDCARLSRAKNAVITSIVLLMSTSVYATDNGLSLFKNACGVCHSTNLVNRLGPSLVGINLRISGTLEGYDFSPAMKSAAIQWNQESLNKFLLNPKSMVKETKMNFPGLADNQKRQEIVDFLLGLDQPK